MFLSQTFSVSDIPTVITLFFLELLLSADNAIVLGLVSHHLEPAQRRKALYIGVASAFILRAIGLLAASYLLHYFWIQLLGAAYLIYLAVRHFVRKDKKMLVLKPVHSFWKTVALIELFDIAFAIDSILAGIAFVGPSTQTIHPKLWIVYLGGMLGLVSIRYAADLFSHLIDRYPRLETSAYLMIIWIGCELACNALAYPIPLIVFWPIIVALFAFGFTSKPSKSSH